MGPVTDPNWSPSVSNERQTTPGMNSRLIKTPDSQLRVTHLKLRNWRNFKNVDVDIAERCFIFGPNASGKSNFLDALRFLRDLTVDPGGLQFAVQSRGGMRAVRSLFSRNNNKGKTTIGVSIGTDEVPTIWEYELTFDEESKLKRPIVVEEIVRNKGILVLDRKATSEDDAETLTQSRIEQVTQNRDFRPVAEFFRSIGYLHLVPQVIRDPKRSGDGYNDPYGGDFIARIAKTSKQDKTRRLKLINAALKLAVPQLDDLQQILDIDGQPHLQARYKNWRPSSGFQNERDFSDGTLRLIGLLWSLQEKSGPALLEEPELSLHDAVVEQLPSMIARATKRTGRQVIATTHAWAILDDEGLGCDEVLVLTSGAEGTKAAVAGEFREVKKLIDSNFSLREALHSELILPDIKQLKFLDFA
jgi:predicted ATPase